MPLVSDEFADKKPLLLRILAWGPEKVKKTWWALNAAKAGFNVIYLDADDGSQILTQVDASTYDRIAHIWCNDKTKDATASVFLTHFLAGKEFIWNETKRDILITTITRDKSHEYVRFNISKLTPNDIVLMDAWTSFVLSLANRWNIENNLDIVSNAAAIQSDWPGYRWTGAVASQWLKQMKTLNCHVIVIGHQTVYEKYKEVKSGDKKTRELEWMRRQIISTSNPHSMTVGKDFTDILNFRMKKNLFKISTEAHEEAIGGCRVVKPGEYRWEELQFADICKMADIAIPNNTGKFNSEALTFYKPGAVFPEDEQHADKIKLLGITPGKSGQIDAEKTARTSLSGLVAAAKSK